MWGIRMAPPLKPVAWAIAWAWPKMGRGATYTPGTSGNVYSEIAPFEDNLLTSDPEMFRWITAQTRALPELALGGPSLQWLYEALTETRRLKALDSPPVPALTHIGTDERVVDTAAVVERMARWPDGSLTHVAGAQHEIMIERKPIRDSFFDAAAALFARAA